MKRFEIFQLAQKSIYPNSIGKSLNRLFDKLGVCNVEAQNR